jgi:hypothetical protein
MPELMVLMHTWLALVILGAAMKTPGLISLLLTLFSTPTSSGSVQNNYVRC